jgi:hypothetical protein
MLVKQVGYKCLIYGSYWYKSNLIFDHDVDTINFKRRIPIMGKALKRERLEDLWASNAQLQEEN